MGLNPCVPVFDTDKPSPEKASHVSPVGLNAAHEGRLVGFLVSHYGWRLTEDGNLYNPQPNRFAWGARG
jgi:hypothetical protein